MSHCCIEGNVGARFWNKKKGHISGSAVSVLICCFQIVHKESNCYRSAVPEQKNPFA